MDVRVWVLGQDSSHVLAWQQWSMDSDYSEGRRRAPGGPAGGGGDAADSGVLAKLRGQKKEAFAHLRLSRASW